MTGLPARVDVVVVGAGLAGLAAAVRAAPGRAGGAGARGLGRRGRPGAHRRGRRPAAGPRLPAAQPGLPRAAPAGPARRARPARRWTCSRSSRGVVVAHGGRRAVLADPRQRCRGHLRSTLTGPGSVRDKLALARWALDVVRADPRALVEQPDEPLSSRADPPRHHRPAAHQRRRAVPGRRAGRRQPGDLAAVRRSAAASVRRAARPACPRPGWPRCRASSPRACRQVPCS